MAQMEWSGGSSPEGKAPRKWFCGSGSVEVVLWKWSRESSSEEMVQKKQSSGSALWKEKPTPGKGKRPL